MSTREQRVLAFQWMRGPRRPCYFCGKPAFIEFTRKELGNYHLWLRVCWKCLGEKGLKEEAWEFSQEGD
jgi:GH25 family lysozyme M1 (1,4-beta-N-acetylmuramidase)